MKVKDFMIRDVFVKRKDDSIKSLLQLFVDKKIGGAPIVDENHRLITIVSDGDILRYLNHKDTIIYEMFMFGLYYFPDEDYSIKTKVEATIGSTMKQKKIFSVKEEDDMQEVLDILSKHHFKKIPVIDEDRHLVGIISRGDILRQIHSQLLEL